MGAAVYLRFDGEVFRPINSDARFVAKKYETGKVYRMQEVEERSAKSHDHYFPTVRQAFDTLPDRIRNQFKDWEEFRGFCLVKCHYYTCVPTVCGSTEEVDRAKAQATAQARASGRYALVTSEGYVVYTFVAESQDYDSMKKKRFQKSKEDVLAYIEDLLEVDRGTLKNLKEAA